MYRSTLHTYLLTPRSRVLLEKLTGSAASQDIPRIFGNRRFLTVLTSARHLSLSWANSIQSPQLPPTSWRSILILSSHLRLGLPRGLFPSGFLTRIMYTTLPSPIKKITSGSFCLQRKHLDLWIFLNMGFHGEALLTPRPTPNLEDHPSSAVRDCLFNIFAATLHIGGRSSIRNLRTRHAVVTGTHLTWPFHFTEPYSLCKFHLPKVQSLSSLDCVNVHALLPYVRTGLCKGLVYPSLRLTSKQSWYKVPL